MYIVVIAVFGNLNTAAAATKSVASLFISFLLYILHTLDVSVVSTCHCVPLLSLLWAFSSSLRRPPVNEIRPTSLSWDCSLLSMKRCVPLLVLMEEAHLF